MKTQKLLNKELRAMYHNATLYGTLTVESDYEQDLYDQVFQDECEGAIDFLNETLEENYPSLARFGKVCQWGRGGRTLAPEGLVDSNGYPLDADELFQDTPEDELEQILTDLARFNRDVRNWCKVTPDAVLMNIREHYREELAQNKGKKRATITVYR